MREREYQRENEQITKQLTHTAELLDEATREREVLRLELGELANKAKLKERDNRDHVKKLEIEIAYLQAQLEDKERKIVSLEKDIEELLGQKEQALSEVSEEKKTIELFNSQRAEMAAQLLESQALLRMSEAERVEAKKKFLEVADMNAQLMNSDLSGSDVNLNADQTATVRLLNKRFRAMKEQKEKERKKTERLVSQMESALNAKKMENVELEKLLEEERAKHREEVAALSEAQRKTLQEHNLGELLSG